jgi:hypothetical protein
MKPSTNPFVFKELEGSHENVRQRGIKQRGGGGHQLQILTQRLFTLGYESKL